MKTKNYFSILKRVGRLCLLSGTMLVATSVFAADITTGLIIHYDFEAVSGTTVPDVSGSAFDGTLAGAAAVTTGYIGQSGLQCTAKADYLSLPAGFTTNLTSFTYSAWVKLDALKDATRFFDLGIGANSSSTNNFLAFIPSLNGDDQYMVLRYRPASGTAYNVASTVKCPVGVWAHVAVTYNWNGTYGTATIYLNGSAVGTGTNLPYNPSLSLGSTTDNFVGYSRWPSNTNGFGGVLDDVRFYNRALTTADIMALRGVPSELTAEYNNLTASTLIAGGNLTNVTSNLNMPQTVTTPGVSITWTSSNTAVVSLDGTVTRPTNFDATSILTATLSETSNGETYTLVKSFTVVVKATNILGDILANWDFNKDLIFVENGLTKVKSSSEMPFVGTVMNDATIRTIGAPTSIQYNVLYTGNGTGYFDLGTAIGEAVYSLTDYTIAGYFRADDDAVISTGGNFYWTLSNTADAVADPTGYIIGQLNVQRNAITPTLYSAEQGVSAGTAAPVGGWHHIAYVQSGTTGTVFVDGVSVATAPVSNLPSTTLPIIGRTGTYYNWLGRSPYVLDNYLKKTMLYGFQLMKATVSGPDLINGYDVYPGVLTTIQNLDAAYAENPNYVSGGLADEANNLTLGDLSAVTSNITLPTKGTLDNTINISWTSSNTLVIANDGTVTRPKYFNVNDTLIATLSKDAQTITKSFPATVLLEPGTEFTTDLIVKYDFSSVSDSTVTDAAEMHFAGKIKNNASIASMGTTQIYKVLNLGDGNGYFDMGLEVGKVLYHLNDYTMSCYYRIDASYEDILKNGNYLWLFSNSTDALTGKNGYINGTLTTQAVSITPTFYSAKEAVSYATAASLGGWHNLTYTQSGTIGTVYVDGYNVASGTVNNLPSTTLPKVGLEGTPFNWIGRSCYPASDVYLRKTLVYDFRLYKLALDADQIKTSVLNVEGTIPSLDNAYNEYFNGVIQIVNSPYKVTSTVGEIKIIGLQGTEKVSVFDIAGRQLKVVNVNRITTNAGIYFVKVDNYVAKVIVK